MRIILIFLSLLSAPVLLAQEAGLPKVDFSPLSGKAHKKALLAHRRAVAAWEWDRTAKKALREVRKLERMMPQNGSLNLFAAALYAYEGDRDRQLAQLQEAMDHGDREVQKQALSQLAKLAHQAGQWQQSLNKIDSLLNGFTLDSAELGQLRAMRKVCLNGMALYAQPRKRVFLENPGRALNSPSDDYKAVLPSKGKHLYFSSRRKGSTGGSLDGLQHYEDIYQATALNGSWRRASNIGFPLNAAGHEGVLSSQAKNKMLILYKGRNEGDLFFTKYQNGGWSDPVPLPEVINSAYAETSAVLSEDGNTLYFTSERPGGHGGSDIYISHKTKAGWQAPENLGPAINTPLHEEGLSLSPDGKWLYFSSEGHTAIGGLDLFRVAVLPKGLGPVQQLDWPINSPYNELHLGFQNDSLAWLSTDRHGGEGGYDLWQVAFLGGAVDWPLSDWEWVSLSETDAAADWTHELVNALSGEGRAEDDTLELPAVASESEMMVVLKDINFLTGSTALTAKAKAVLRSVVGLLQQHPEWELRINGHTDNVGNESDNLILSEARAKAVANYLISKGIAGERLYSKGFGDAQPIADNATAEGRKMNRRIAFELIKPAD